MPTNITPVDDWGALDIVQGPSTGDAGSSAGIRGALQIIENRLERVRVRAPWVRAAGSTKVECHYPMWESGTFITNLATQPTAIAGITAASSQYSGYAVPIVGMAGARITSFQMWLTGTGCTVVPTTPMTATLYNVDVGLGAATSLGVITDTAATTGAFNAQRTISLSPTITETISNSDRYVIHLCWGNGGTFTSLLVQSLAVYVDGGA